MTSPISAILSASGAGPTPSAATASTSGGQQLDENAFLKLLVAQLKYQDPSNPTDSSQFMAQTAQFTQVQTLQKLADEQQQLLTAQQVQSAAAMVGRTVTYTKTDGTEATGVVASATVSGGSPTLRVGTDDVPMSRVTKITNATA